MNECPELRSRRGLVRDWLWVFTFSVKRLVSVARTRASVVTINLCQLED